MHRVTFTTLLAVLAACDRPTPAPPPAAPPPGAVAWGKSFRVTIEDFDGRIASLPPSSRELYQQPALRAQLVDGLVREELLALAAKKRGLDGTPAVQRQVKAILSQALMQVLQEEAARGPPPAEEELRRYFQAHLAEYVRPERLRVAHLLFRTPEGAPRREAMRKARQALEEVRRAEAAGDAQAFARAAEKSEDPATVGRGGELGFYSREEMERMSRSFADAAVRLKEVGEMALAESPQGVHVVRLLGRMEAQDRSFEQARGELAERVRREGVERRLDQLLAELEREEGVQRGEAHRPAGR